MIDWILGLLLLGAASGPGAASTSRSPTHEPKPAATSRLPKALNTADATPVACRMDALTPAQRTRHHRLLTELLSRVRNVEELDRGYRVSLDDKTGTLASTAEWMSLERRCCPFFEFALEWSAERGATLMVTGPPGAKELVAAMLAARDEGR